MKIIKIINIFLLTLVLAINCCAVNISSGEVVYEDENITVTFSNDTKYSIDEQKVIADMLVYGADESRVNTYNIICDLFGHNLSREYIEVIQHKVDDLSPRCVKKTYSADGCSRCDYFEYELISFVYVPCCPEE